MSVGVQSDMKLWDRLFQLPPIEKRRMIKSPLWAIFVFRAFMKEKDDSYIYYKAFVISAIVCLIIGLMYIASYLFQMKFNLFFFEVSLPEKGFVDVFLKTYPFQIAKILGLVIFPYFLVTFRHSINPKTYDLLWWHPTFKNKRTRNRGKIICIYLLGILLLIIAASMSFALPYMLMEGQKLESSFCYLLGLIAFFSWISSAIFMWLLICVAVIWRYMGNYSGK